MNTVEIRRVESFGEPAFTEMVFAILHDPDRRVVGERLFGTGGTQSTKSGAHQVRVGAFEGDALIGWSHAWLLPGGILYVGNSGVRPDRRQQGVYTRLVAAIEAEARALGCQRVDSHHRAGNSAVLIAKLKAGYTIVGTEFSVEMGLLLKMCKYLEPRRDALLQARLGIIEGVVRAFGPASSHP
jgi:ribosomal protein S18 acetylase RimI-like enzyme